MLFLDPVEFLRHFPMVSRGFPRGSTVASRGTGSVSRHAEHAGHLQPGQLRGAHRGTTRQGGDQAETGQGGGQLVGKMIVEDDG